MSNMARLTYDPFPFVFSRGDEPTRLWCLAFFGLSDSPRGRSGLLKLLKQQRSDGTFASALDDDTWGMRETVRNGLLLLRVGLPPQGINVASAVTFILAHQNADGGWCENPSLDIPPFVQIFLSNEQSVTWVTADAIELLRQVGLGDRAECQRAVVWLRAMQNEHGGWPSYAKPVGARRGTGDPDVTAQITFLMREIYGERDPAYRKGRELLEQHLSDTMQDVERGYRVRSADGQREEVEVYQLTHLLLSWVGDLPRRIDSGYNASDRRVKRMMEALIETQRDDGGWRPFWAEESSPVYTVLAVKALVLTGVLSRTDLEADVKVLAG